MRAAMSAAIWEVDMLTDDQRARCAEMCGWTHTTGSEFFPETWFKAFLPVSHGTPPPIETMPEEWVKLMERLHKADVMLVPFLDSWKGVHEKWSVIGPIGECVCLAALAMEGKS